MTPSQGEARVWTPHKLNQAWRVFDKALVVIADAISVPADELRAFLLDGTPPPVIIDHPVDASRQTLEQRIVVCHEQHPSWGGRQVAAHLEANYDTVRGLASRANITWPSAATQDAALIGALKGTKFMLRSSSGAFLHMGCKIYTKEKSYAWSGTADQLRAVRDRFAAAAGLQAIAVNDPRLVPSVRA